MPDTILVTYATRAGSTAGVAQRIADTLRRQGESVTLRPLAEVDELKGYKAVVLGSAIRDGKWLPEATQFVEGHREALSQRPTAYFEVCMTLHTDTPETRATVARYFEPLLKQFPEIAPVAKGMFAGKVDFSRLPFVTRTLFRLFRSPQGDWRDWKAIEAWSRDVLPLLNRQRQPLPV